MKSAAPNAKGPGIATAEAPQEYRIKSLHSAAGENERKAHAAKELATLAAECALHYGAALTAIEGDDGHPEFVLTRNALSKRFRMLDDVRRWLNELQGTVT